MALDLTNISIVNAISDIRKQNLYYIGNLMFEKALQACFGESKNLQQILMRGNAQTKIVCKISSYIQELSKAAHTMVK
jgi:hypothetical protein